MLNGKTFEASLPHMAVTSVVAMVAPHVAGHPPLHEGTECVRGRGLQHEMKMIGHQTKAQDADRKLALRHLQQREECGVVGLVVKHHRAAVATVEDMVGVSGKLTTRNPRHKRSSVGEEWAQRQEESSLSLYFPLTGEPLLLNLVPKYQLT